MKLIVLLVPVILVACGGSLSDEQRKQMHRNMEEHKIVRVTDVEIMEAAYAKGRHIADVLDSLGGDSTALGAFLQKQRGMVRFITPEASSNARPMEKQLIDAYLADPRASAEDNVQELRDAGGDYDSLLYTQPVTTVLADSTIRLEGVWNIRLPKKELVMEIARTK